MTTQKQTPSMNPHQSLIYREAEKELNTLKNHGGAPSLTQKKVELWNSIMVRVSMGKEVRWLEDVQLTLHLLQKEGVNVDAFSARVSIKPEFV